MSLSGFVVKQIALSKVDDSNPREAILRHAKVNSFSLLDKEMRHLFFHFLVIGTGFLGVAFMPLVRVLVATFTE